MKRAALVLLLLTGCSSDQVFLSRSQIPDEVDRIALFAWDADSSDLLLSTPILEIGQSLVLDDIHPDSWIVGYREKDLLEIGGEGAPLAQDPVELAADCDALLPTPIFAGQMSGTAIAPLEVSRVPALTAAWLDAETPPNVQGLVPDVRCIRQPCLPAIETQGCEFTMRLNSCLLGDVGGTIRDDGSIVLDRTPAPNECTPRTPPEGAVASSNCRFGSGDCGIDLYRLDETPFVEILDEVQVLDVPFMETTDPRVSRPSQARAGYLMDMALVGDELVVLTADGNFTENATSSCVSAFRRRINRYALSDLSLIGTTSVSGCIDQIVANPRRDSFFVAVEGIRNPTVHVSEMDLEGRIIHTATLSDPPPEPLTDGYVWHLGLSPDESALAITVRYGTGDRAEFRSTVAVFEVPSLELRGPPITNTGVETNESVAAFSAGELVVVDEQENALYWYDPTTGEELSNATIPHERSFDVATLWVDPRSSRLAVLIPSEQRFAAFFEDRQPSTSAAFFAVDGGPLWLARWPLDDRLQLVSATTVSHPPDGLLTLLDPDTERFLPKVQRVGKGPASKVLVDDQDRIYVLLPWEAKVVRARPVPGS